MCRTLLIQGCVIHGCVIQGYDAQGSGNFEGGGRQGSAAMAHRIPPGPDKQSCKKVKRRNKKAAVRIPGIAQSVLGPFILGYRIWVLERRGILHTKCWNFCRINKKSEKDTDALTPG